MIAELAAAMSALKETAGLVKTINEAKTEAEIKSATYELNNKLLVLQSECFSLGESIRSRDEDVALLKRKIADFESFTIQSEGFELRSTDGGSFVYSKEITSNGNTLNVNACPNCYQMQKFSMLQPSIDKAVKVGYWIHKCPSCNADFKMHKANESHSVLNTLSVRSNY